MKRFFLLSTLVVVGAFRALPVHAQTPASANDGQKGQAQEAAKPPKMPKEDPIDTERPGFTNGTGTVAPGHIQFEAGYVYANDTDTAQHRLFDSALLRVPTGTNTEIRVGLPTYTFTHLYLSYALSGAANGAENTRGFGDTSLSVKWRFLDAPKPRTRPSLALIAQTTLPTGEPAYRETHFQPSLALEGSYDLSENWNLQSDFVYTRAADSGQTFNQFAGAINLSHNLTDTTGVFVETYRIAPTGQGAYNGNYLDFGVTHVLASNTQLDINLGRGINSAAKDNSFVGFGVAHRW